MAVLGMTLTEMAEDITSQPIAFVMVTEKLPDTVVPMPVVPLLSIFDKDAVFLHSIAYIAKLPSLYPALISTNSNSDDVNQDSSMNVDKSKDEKGETNDLNQPSSSFS